MALFRGSTGAGTADLAEDVPEVPVVAEQFERRDDRRL
jgi:hypothetical protein